MLLVDEGAAEISQGNLDNYGVLMGFMAEVLIVRAEMDVCGAWIEYTGVSTHFDELNEGDSIPEYLIEFQRDRVCNRCGGTNWGPASNISVSITPGDPSDFHCCQQCGNQPEHSRFVSRFKACRRVR